MASHAVEVSQVEAVLGRVFEAGVGAIELLNVYLGVRLGLYRALAEHGPLTAAELARRTELDERYVREWAQALAVSGLGTADGPDVTTARFGLADGVREVLVDETGPTYLGGLAEALAAAGVAMPALVSAFRTGGPVPLPAYGPHGVSAQAALNRPAFLNDLVATWLPGMPDVQERLADAERPARVGDFGCGAGWASVALARAYPWLRITGLDVDETSIATAYRNVAEGGVADRVLLETRDLGDSGADWSPRFDVVFFFECVHDLPRPVEALRHARESLLPGGVTVVMDENAAETFTAPGDEVERFLAAVSVVWCLPQGRVGPDPEPVGTVMRPSIMRSLAERAGYSAVDILDIEHPFFRFYRLTP